MKTKKSLYILILSLFICLISFVSFGNASSTITVNYAVDKGISKIMYRHKSVIFYNFKILERVH